MSHDEIIKLAAILIAVDQPPHNEQLMQEFKSAMDQIHHSDAMLVMFASKLLEGKSFLMESDNSNTGIRFRAIADAIGAITTTSGPGKMFFQPPPRHH